MAETTKAIVARYKPQLLCVEPQQNSCNAESRLDQDNAAWLERSASAR